jgi:DNA-binding response OmpR family regulator
LHDAGYVAIEAPDPRSALDRFRAHGSGIDVVITDLVMPHMHGRDLALAMRAVRPKVKVLFTSGYADDAQGDATDYGIAFIQKPFSPTELLARVRALLDT